MPEKLIHIEIISEISCAMRFGEKSFDKKVLEIIKSLPGAKYIPDTKEWTFKRELLEEKFYPLMAPVCISNKLKIV